MRNKCWAEKEKILVDKRWCEEVKCIKINNCKYLKFSERLFKKFIIKK